MNRNGQAAVLAVLLLVVVPGGLFGWHVWNLGEAKRRAEELPSLELVSRAIPVEVRINPLTNVAVIALDVKFAAEPENLLAKLAASVGVTIGTELWPSKVEEILQAHARETWDLYAMMIPYRASVEETPGEDS